MYTLIDTREGAERVSDDLLASPYPTAIDTETAGINPVKESPVGTGNVLLVSLYNPAWALPVVVDLPAIQGLKRWIESDKPKLLANAKFDMHMLANEGMGMSGLMMDVIVADALLDENRQGRHGLKTMSIDYLHYELKDLIVYENNTAYLYHAFKEEFCEYAAEDALATFGVAEYLQNALAKESWQGDKSLLDFLYEYLIPFQVVLWKMERRGIKMDESYLDKSARKMSEKILQMEGDIFELVGKAINLDSPDQKAQVLFGQLKLKATLATDTKKCKKCGKKATKRYDYTCPEHGDVYLEEIPSVAAKALKKMDHPVAKLMVERGELVKLRSYCENYKEMIKPWGRIHTTFRIYGAVTGRLSSSNPNLQNVPARESEWGIRKAFICEEQDSIVGADFGQLEYRIVAEISQDPILMEIIKGGHDVHSGVTKEMFHLDCSVAEVKELHSDLRNKGKTLNFGILYGMGPQSLADQLGISVKEARQLMDEYFRRFPVMSLYLKQVHEFCRMNGFVETIGGRKRRLPDIMSWDPAKKGRAQRQAFNARVQGSAADILTAAMIKIDRDKKLKELGAKMLLQIHDEIIFEIPEENAEKAVPIIQHLMEHPFKRDLSIPLEAEPAVGKSWKEAKDD